MPKAAAPIGDLRHRIVIENLTIESDGQGGGDEAWAEFASVWAAVQPTSARERAWAEQLETQRSHRIVIRNLDGITTTMRVNFKGRIFQIHGIRNLDERGYFMILDCEENQGA